MTSTSSAPGLTHPQTNGKAEAFNKIRQAEWAHSRPFNSPIGGASVRCRPCSLWTIITGHTTARRGASRFFSGSELYLPSLFFVNGRWLGCVLPAAR